MADQDNDEEIKKFIKDRYGKIARESNCILPSDKCSCCGENIASSPEKIKIEILGPAKRCGYDEDELKSIPEPAILGLGCGNPTALTDLQEGEVVLDLGAGAGIDVFLAANKVGETGRVVGIDMTPDMINKGQEIAEEYGYSNVNFKLGKIENMPIEDNSIDVIISNCVINLAPDKSKVYQEAFRVLKPGGRILISDLVTEGDLPEDIRKSFEAWSECIAGALEKNEYLNIIKNTGFEHVQIVTEKQYYEEGIDERLVGKIISLNVSAKKPE